MIKTREKYIGLVCQNEVYFQKVWNTILYNLKGLDKSTNYHLITFDYAVKTKYDYVVYLDYYDSFNINKLRYYLKENNTLTLVNVDNGDLDAFKVFENIITFSLDDNAMYYIGNISTNKSLFVFNVFINNNTYEMYYVCNEEYELYYLLSIIIVLLNEGYQYCDIKQAIQKINKPI